MTIDLSVSSSCGLSSLSLVSLLLVTYTIKDITLNKNDCVHATICERERDSRKEDSEVNLAIRNDKQYMVLTTTSLY